MQPTTNSSPDIWEEAFIAIHHRHGFARLPIGRILCDPSSTFLMVYEWMHLLQSIITVSSSALQTDAIYANHRLFS